MKDFEITSASTEEVNAKLDVMLDLRQLLNQKLTLSDYTSEITTLFPVFQCFPPDIKSRNVKEYKVMRRKTPTLELYLILDYDKVMQGTDAENLNYMKEVLLKGCEKFLKPLKGFDWPAFEAALHEHLF